MGKDRGGGEGPKATSRWDEGRCYLASRAPVLNKQRLRVLGIWATQAQHLESSHLMPKPGADMEGSQMKPSTRGHPCGGTMGPCVMLQGRCRSSVAPQRIVCRVRGLRDAHTHHGTHRLDFHQLTRPVS